MTTKSSKRSPDEPSGRATRIGVVRRPGAGSGAPDDKLRDIRRKPRDIRPAFRHSASKTRVNALMAHAGDLLA